MTNQGKKLIKDVQIGVNEQGYTMASVSCTTERMSVFGYSTPQYSEDKELHQDYASVYIVTSDKGYQCEEIKIPFEPKPNENYTTIGWVNEDTMSIVIVPIEFVCIKD